MGEAKPKFEILNAHSLAGEGVIVLGGDTVSDAWGEKFAVAEAFIILRNAPAWRTPPVLFKRRITTSCRQTGYNAEALTALLRRTWVAGELAAHLHEWRKAEFPQGPPPTPYEIAPIGDPSRLWLRDFIGDEHLKTISTKSVLSDLRKYMSECLRFPKLEVEEKWTDIG